MIIRNTPIKFNNYLNILLYRSTSIILDCILYTITIIDSVSTIL